ncbi:MAG: cell division protein FtsQ/DivIB [Solirubrobacteraceae bacterium]|nr:cell division protein FtsQ/DivIB [Solirubrobacteraceae bacterium]
MHRPAALSAPALSPSHLLRLAKGRMPTPRRAAKIGGILFGVLATLVVILLFTPVAHPRDLQVEGVTGSSAQRIRTALEESGGSQSTFMVSEAKLMEAVQGYPEVAAVEVDAHPPFRLDLTVVMRPPVARVQTGGRSVVVAGDGTILERASSAKVPRVDATISNVRLAGSRVTGGRGALAVLAAAPEELLGFARTIRAGDSGLELVLARGPRLIFGNATLAKDKWVAAAAVIADGAAARATYIDLRVPSRPAVGGLGGSEAAGADDAPPTLTAVSPEAAANAAATAATLAAGKAASGRSTGLDTSANPTSSTGTVDPSSAAAGSQTSTGTGAAQTPGTVQEPASAGSGAAAANTSSAPPGATAETASSGGATLGGTTP